MLHRIQVIVTCPSRYAEAADPLILQTVSGQTVLYMTDGSGSWGAGVEAAEWFRDWIAKTHNDGNTVTRTTVDETLKAGIKELPQSIVDEHFHWTFSIVVVIVDDATLQLGACGRFAAAAISQTIVDRLFTP